MDRIEVLKTYKIFIGGKFPRTESGRYYSPVNEKGEALGNICLSSRKDVRNAVVAARKAFGGWSERTAFNRSQILYRIAEMLEGRRDQFITELIQQGSSKKDAIEEVNSSIDRTIYYAGWCDKFTQILSSVNPVSSSHFNFSTYEPMGVIGVIPNSNNSLLGLISAAIPAIASGNTVVVIASENLPLCAVSFAEVVHSSDVPGGVVNILTGKLDELLKPMYTHMDVNGIIYANDNKEEIKLLQESSALNLKRVLCNSDDSQSLYKISELCEVKTTWHPIENIGGASSSY